MDLYNRTKALLSDNGYIVDSFNVSIEALEALETSKVSPYTLILSNYAMPKMKGDEILKAAKKIAPLTQRVLIVDAKAFQTLVSAVNLAVVHACLIHPFRDEELLNQVKQCCTQYEKTLSQKNLKIITNRQNNQLLQIAGNFKKKEAIYFSQIEHKDRKIRILESRIRSADGADCLAKPVELKDILIRRNIPFSPESFGTQFLIIKDQVKQMIETAAKRTLKPVSYPKNVTRTFTTFEHQNVAEKILSLAYILLDKNEPSQVESSINVKETLLDDHFELTFSKNKTTAFIKLKAIDAHEITLSQVKQFLEKNKIITGLKEDPMIEAWLFKATPEDDPFCIAQGRDPKYPKNSKLEYFFSTDFLHAGKIDPDGSINYMDRGDIPQVAENVLLAEKIPPEAGLNGVDVFGNELFVENPEDLTFSSGPGTRLSEDGLKIYSTKVGQPHLDVMGNLSVCPELHFKKNIDFETGNIDFDGNVIVNGCVKQGFKIKCASLSAREIQGAQIDITGDLNVSLGIVDTELIYVKGSVQAYYVHNSKINAFGDLIVQKEIVDSKIYISGACINKNGAIINSEISAKMGIQAGRIGTQSATPSKLTVGVDEHVNRLMADVNSKMTIHNNGINELVSEFSDLEKENQRLHTDISKQSYIQERSQLELKNLKKKQADMKASGNITACQKTLEIFQKILNTITNAKKSIDKTFDRQDEIALVISQKKDKIIHFQDLNKKLLDDKKRILEFSDRKNPLPEISITRKIESGTRIFTANSSLILKNSSSRCRIKEFPESPEAAGESLLYKIRVSPY